MTTSQLPPLPAIDQVRDHPEHHMKWSHHEMAWIKRYAQDYALQALAQQAQAQEPVVWLMQARGTSQFEFARPHQKAMHKNMWTDAFPVYRTTPQPQPAPLATPKATLMTEHRDYIDGYTAGLADGQRLAPLAGEVTDEREAFEASMRERHGWNDRDFKSDSFGYFDGHTATAWLAWQARAALQSPAPQTKGHP